MKKDFLKQKTKPIEIKKQLVSDLVENLALTGFQGKKLGEITKIWREMIKEKEITIWLGISGAIIPAGMRKVISFLVKNRFVDAIVSTGAQMFHETFETLGREHFIGEAVMNDYELFQEGVVRIYDVLAEEMDLLTGEFFIKRMAAQYLKSGQVYSSREITALMGRELSKISKNQDSILINAYKQGVPVFIPSFGDSYIGIAIWYSAMKNNKTFIVDNKAQTVQITNLGLDGGKGWIEAKMPEMLVDENGNTLSDAKYQQYDHLIAAETAYFNQNKNSGKTPTHTNGLSVDDSRTVPDLDPTLVKSIIYQESRVGNYDGNKNDNNNSLQDIMQANVYYNASSHDWHKGKQQFGLTRGGGATPRQSVHAGIGILYQKGLRTSNDLSSTKFLGWDVATQNYNARNPNYSKEVYSRIPKR